MKSEKLWKHQYSSYFSKCTVTKHSATQDATPFSLTCPSWPPLEMHLSWGGEKTIVFIFPRSTAPRNQKGWNEQGERDPIISWVNWILYVSATWLLHDSVEMSPNPIFTSLIFCVQLRCWLLICTCAKHSQLQLKSMASQVWTQGHRTEVVP